MRKAAIRVLVEKLGCPDEALNKRCLQKEKRRDIWGGTGGGGAGGGVPALCASLAGCLFGAARWWRDSGGKIAEPVLMTCGPCRGSAFCMSQ